MAVSWTNRLDGRLGREKHLELLKEPRMVLPLDYPSMILFEVTLGHQLITALPLLCCPRCDSLSTDETRKRKGQNTANENLSILLFLTISLPASSNDGVSRRKLITQK